jgi:hypothetical protein
LLQVFPQPRYDNDIFPSFVMHGQRCPGDSGCSTCLWDFPQPSDRSPTKTQKTTVHTSVGRIAPHTLRILAQIH